MMRFPSFSSPNFVFRLLTSVALSATVLPACGSESDEAQNQGGDGDASGGDGDAAQTYECYDSSECGVNAECSGGSCVPTMACTAEAQCGDGFTCFELICRARCTDDTSCPGLQCDAAQGICVPLANPTAAPGTGGGSSGGGTGTGAAPATGGAGNPPPPEDPTFDVIDDFEDGDVDIYPTNGRTGFWYTYNETATQGPAVDGAASARPLASNPVVEGESYAIHATGTHYDEAPEDQAYGGIGVDLSNANADGKQSRSESRQMYDASAWDGVQFRIKSGATSPDQSIRFEVVTREISNGPGGDCMAGPDCWDAYGRDVTLTSEWTTVKIPFASMVQEGWGLGVTFKPAEILGFGWEDLNKSPWDFWIDDLQFYAEPEGVDPGGPAPNPMCGDSWGEESNGSITWYTFDQGTDSFGDINCSYGITTGVNGVGDHVNGISTTNGNEHYFAAINTVDYNQSATCGACVEVTRDNGASVVATVVDQCPVDINPKCVKGHLDLSKAAFLQLGTEVEGYVGARAGNSAITWKYVDCPTSGNVHFRLKEPNNSNWNQVIVENHTYPIASVQVNVDGNWVNASREPYNFWIPPGGRFGSSPYQIRATDINGNEVTGTVSLGNGNTADPSLGLQSGANNSGQQLVCSAP